MVSIESAENALKTVYLGVVANQLNTNANPLLAKIEQTSSDVWGKEVRKLAPYGINGGIGAGTETGSLPTPAENKYVQFVSELKNLYGKIELSDKAIRASSNNAGAFVNLLNAEMEGLIKASKFNFSRMIYGDGTGLLATTVSASSSTKGIVCDTVKNFIEGMVVDIYNTKSSSYIKQGARITYVDRANKTIYLDCELSSYDSFTGYKIYVQGSKDNEITGLGKIFSNSATLYGVVRADYPWLKPYEYTTEAEISDELLQTAIDTIDENVGNEVNFITCSTSVRKAYQEYLGYFRRNIDVMELAGGYKALSFNGIPVYADRFVEDGTLYLLNTDDFALHQLCDWKWLEGENGKVLKQANNSATYTATLVKYADLICDRPNGQAKISNIKTTVTNPFVSVVSA